MLTPQDIVLDSTVSFDLYAPQVLGTGWKNAKTKSILDADDVRFLGIDPAAMHANVYPSLPAGTPNDFRAYKYLKLVLASGEVTAVGLPWIKQDTYVVSTNQKMIVTIDNVSPDMQNSIRLALSAIGVSVYDVQLQ